MTLFKTAHLLNMQTYSKSNSREMLSCHSQKSDFNNMRIYTKETDSKTVPSKQKDNLNMCISSKVGNFLTGIVQQYEFMTNANSLKVNFSFGMLIRSKM